MYTENMWAELSESVSSYEELIAEMKASRAAIQRSERRIVLLGALLAVDGASVEWPTDISQEVAERFMARIAVINDACGKQPRVRHQP